MSNNINTTNMSNNITMRCLSILDRGGVRVTIVQFHLREVIFNDSLQKIDNDVVCIVHTRSLSSIVLPSAVTEIGIAVFADCDSLRQVILLGIPRKIGVGAFYNRISLERFTLPIISTRLDNLIQTGLWSVEKENEVDEVRGVVERSGGDLFVSSNHTMGTGGAEGRNWSREDLDKIIRLISYYEVKEATSMLELALWKFKLDQVDKANGAFQLQAFQLKADSAHNNIQLIVVTLLGAFTKRCGVPSCHHSCWKRVINYLEHAKEMAGYLVSHEYMEGCIKCADWPSSDIHENIIDNFPERIMQDAWNYHPHAFEFIQLPLHQLIAI